MIIKPFNLINEFNEFLLYNERYDKTSHWGGSVSRCSRQQYYSWTDAEKTNPATASGVLKMKYGNKTEEIYRDFLDFCIKKEIKINGLYKIIAYQHGWKERYNIDGLKYPITCNLDFVINFENIETKEVFIVASEVKSAYGQKISTISKTQKPDVDYLKQVFIYISLSPFKEFLHPYFARDNGFFTGFFVRQHEEGLLVCGWGETLYKLKMEKAIDKLKKVEESLEKGIPPERDYMVCIKKGAIQEKMAVNKTLYSSDWQCKYCDYMDLCWKDEKEKYKFNNNHLEFVNRENEI